MRRARSAAPNIIDTATRNAPINAVHWASMAALVCVPPLVEGSGAPEPPNQMRPRLLAHHTAEGSNGRKLSMATRLETRETTHSLIGSDKVDGTAVYGADQQKIGSIERVMIDKISGKVAYAVLSFGGFMGMGEDYYPVPWSTLNYDTNLGGYRVNLTKDQIEKAPRYSETQGWDWSRENDRRVYDYYRANPYWDL